MRVLGFIEELCLQDVHADGNVHSMKIWWLFSMLLKLDDTLKIASYGGRVLSVVTTSVG